ncbi:HD-GYP domain-containing protein [Alteromonas sp. ASW11-130]|uniref:HD-GYP domain-containing protein n=1 Tax=Alteromonas sp. ASW11-130 TaxID=3015775 RepID=UPI002241AFDE|nr:HD-GYP domain-containing protein [Alteromonas sp. ASW11-130]MCW8092733.1 HD-GYP domain-containing protein [Alteromonas sp. ASW11-130]
MTQFQTIDIDDLQVGMYVIEFVRQDGDLAIKNSGFIHSAATIELLNKNGVKRIIIDPSRSKSKTEKEGTTLETVNASAKVTKPSGNDVSKALRLHSRGVSLQKLIHESIKKNRPFSATYAAEFTDLVVDFIESNPTAMGCATRIRKKDSYLLEHSLNVSVHLIQLAQHMKLSASDVQDVGLAGFLIDVGKIRIPDEILFKPGKVTKKEMEVIKGHVKLGEEYLQQQGYPEKIIKIVGQHHERLDGSGYPKKLSGDEICQFGRMIAIADVYDAVTADRPYRAGMTHQQALKILLSESQTRLDTTLVQHFIKCNGIFPEGTLVELSNGHVAMVFKENKDAPLRPVVKPFYSIKSKHYLAVKEIDLAKSESIKIVRQVKDSQLSIDFHKVFHEKMA